MSKYKKRVWVYEQEHQTSSYIEFAAHQLDLLPLTARNAGDAQKVIEQDQVDIAFMNTGSPSLNLPKEISVILIIDEGNHPYSLSAAFSCFLNDPQAN